MDYRFKDIEKKWQQFWAENETYKADNNSSKPKYYVLDMFPYPSGAGLHVGHPLGYIASDIFARYKRLRGFNVLHPMGYDSFGLPAEQYAIQTGQHPAITTETNIKRYREQLDNIGFSFDWSREVRTSDPDYYKWTQWIFMQLFNSWYNVDSNKAEPIENLKDQFGLSGSKHIKAVFDEDVLSFPAEEWNSWSEEEQQRELLKYRLTYLRESTVNWCPALGTVLANDEVKDGVSERGGYPVEQKKMMQWSMRITAYADRLLEGLDVIDWPEPLKEMQRNWIGKSVGASVRFGLTPNPSTGERGAEPNKSQSQRVLPAGEDFGGAFIEVFTTRVDTIFGVSFLVLAPEHELIERLTTAEQKPEIDAYIDQTKRKSELDRMADAKAVSGAFTGSYALNPLNGEQIPIWIADYVLAGYGTGAVMAVPSGDQRDYLFAKKYNLPIIQILDAQKDIENLADATKEGRYINSDFINGLAYKEAIPALTAKLEAIGAGKAKVQYRMRDAVFGRQRYWGEPVPVYFNNDLPYLIDEKDLPLVLPEIDKYLPTESGEPPLGRAENWRYTAPPKSSPQGRTSSSYREQSDPENYVNLRDNAKLHRKDPTKAESVLWEFLRGAKTGFKFRRQHPVDNFIADFACLEKGLIVEVDGGYHASIIQEDARRTAVLNHYGFKVIRFTNEEVLANPQKVAEKVAKTLSSLADRNIDAEPEVSPTGGDLEGAPYELSTMPGWAGSSWYWYRYMASAEEREQNVFAPEAAIKYWKDVDLYIGGSEHATGHLLYSRFWSKLLKDLGYVVEEEPFKKLINQGMIQGRSNFVYRVLDEEGKGINTFVSAGLKNQYKVSAIHVDVNIVENDVLDIEKFRASRLEFEAAELILEDGSISSQSADGGGTRGAKYICGHEVEKMSKSKFNVVNPDDIIERYGADTLRMYEMFLGPLEQSKPWNTNGIEGVSKFLRKFWKLFHDDQLNLSVSEEEPTKPELKSLHKIIRKVEEDIERFSFNTSVSSFMICVNELTDLKCNKRRILQELVIVLAPYAPHITEELWTLLGNDAGTLSYTQFPKFNPNYLIEDEFAYPISFNGKMKMNLNISLTLEPAEMEKFALASPEVQKYLEGKTPKKVIAVKGKIINIVV